jgi:NitT/TauT family transport system substrate-binding protein
VAKNSPLRTAKDLEGKTIGVSGLNDQSTSAIKEWLDRGGADIASVHFVEVPFPVMGAALAQGRIDAAQIREPGLSAAVASTARVFAKPFDLIAPEFLIGVWFSTTDWVKKNPEAARKFAAAIYEAARWANTHHAESAGDDPRGQGRRADPEIAVTPLNRRCALPLKIAWVSASESPLCRMYSTCHWYASSRKNG